MTDPVKPKAPARETRLIERPDAPQTYALRREEDLAGACVRALCEYLEQQAVPRWPGGRAMRPAAVVPWWADGEEPAQFPSLMVWMPEDGMYDDSSFTPKNDPAMRVGKAGDGPGLYLQKQGEFSAELVVDVWATDRHERKAMVGMVEDALSPVDWMYGCRLELPYYHNARLTLTPLRVAYADDQVSAQQRVRRARLTVGATLPWLRVAGPRPYLRTRFELDEVAE